MIQATTDEVTFNPSVKLIKEAGKFVITYDYFKNFFLNVDRYFNDKNRRDIPLQKRITLAQVCMPLYETSPSLVRLPSVRLSGSNSFFRPIIIDKMEIITFLDIQRLLKQQLFHKRFGQPEQKSFTKEIFVGAGIKYLLVYLRLFLPRFFRQVNNR